MRPPRPPRESASRPVAVARAFVVAVATAVFLFVLRVDAFLGSSSLRSGAINVEPHNEPELLEDVEARRAAEQASDAEQIDSGDEVERPPSVAPTPPFVGPFKPWSPGKWGPETVGNEAVPLMDWPLTGGRDEDLFLSQNDESVQYGGSWKTPVVIIPAAYDEFVADTPGWMRELLTSEKRSLFLYQRMDTAKAHWAHNIGFESGIYLRFIVDHYDNLPEVMVMVHGIPDGHNPRWREWTGCLRPNMTYTSLNTEWVEDRSIDAEAPSLAFSPYQHWTEQCMRDVLDLIGTPAQPKQALSFRTYCCAQFAVHRDVIRRRPKALWQELYSRFGAPPGICHKGPSRPLDELVSNSPVVLAGQKTWGEEHEDGEQHGKIVLGLTLEHLSGAVFGFEPWAMAGPYGQDHYCAQFFPASQCPGSPCER